MFLLGKLVSKMVSVTFKLTMSEEKMQSDIILKALRQIRIYLEIGQDLLSNSNVPNFKNTNQTKRVLANLLE